MMSVRAKCTIKAHFRSRNAPLMACHKDYYMGNKPYRCSHSKIMVAMFGDYKEKLYLCTKTVQTNYSYGSITNINKRVQGQTSIHP